jgi:competence protein ComEC
MKFKRAFVCLLLAITLLALCACAGATQKEDSSQVFSSDAENTSSESAGDNSSSESAGEDNGLGNEMRVHFLDVGQGDSIFIELPNGECMLIDASERAAAGDIVSFIDCLGYKKIDHLIATHPHADHIGGMKIVIEHFEIGEVYMPEAITDTKTFINLLETIDGKGASITPVKAGLEVDFGGAKGVFVAPSTIVDDMNNCSAVLHLTYGQRSFLLTGDAEIEEESTITANVKCDVLKAGHHGSSTSSGELLLKNAKPSVVVISCGEGNSYGHPHKEALDRFESAGITEIYRTDISGTVSITTNKSTLEITEGTKCAEHKYVLNFSTKKIHLPSCESAVEMKESNRAYTVRELDELQKYGYASCSRCKAGE